MVLKFVELDFLEWNSSSMNSSFTNFFFIFIKVSVRYILIVQKSSFKLKFDFYKIKFQNKGIYLNSFRHMIFYWKVLVKGVNAHFGCKTRVWGGSVAKRNCCLSFSYDYQIIEFRPLILFLEIFVFRLK